MRRSNHDFRSAFAIWLIDESRMPSAPTGLTSSCDGGPSSWWGALSKGSSLMKWKSHLSPQRTPVSCHARARRTWSRKLPHGHGGAGQILSEKHWHGNQVIELNAFLGGRGGSNKHCSFIVPDVEGWTSAALEVVLRDFRSFHSHQTLVVVFYHTASNSSILLSLPIIPMNRFGA